MRLKPNVGRILSDSVLEHYAVLFSLFAFISAMPLLMFLLSQKDFKVKPSIPLILGKVNPQPICSYQKIDCQNDSSCDEAIFTCPNSVYDNSNQNSSPYLPVGLLDTVDCTKITGWSYNSYNPYKIITIYIYADGTYQNGKLLTVLPADLKLDSNDVVSLFGPHEFYYSFPSSLKDGYQHEIYAYGSELASNSGQLSLLLGSPKVVTCAEDKFTPIKTTIPRSPL